MKFVAAKNTLPIYAKPWAFVDVTDQDHNTQNVQSDLASIPSTC